jgi:hypothetical protein
MYQVLLLKGCSRALSHYVVSPQEEQMVEVLEEMAEEEEGEEVDVGQRD